jgi:hypothetical protein
MPGQQGMKSLKQMGQPEGRIADVRLLVLQPEYRAAHLAQQRAAVDLFVQLVRLQLFDRTGQRAESREMRAYAFLVEAAYAGVLRHQPRGTTGRWIEVVLQIQVRTTEVIDRRVGRYRDPPLSLQILCCSSLRSEASSG